MNIWASMIQALKGESADTRGAQADAEALRILDAEIRSASLGVKQSRDALAELVVKQKLAEEEIKQTQQLIAEHEEYARQALAQNNETLALEVAEKIVELEETQRHKTDIRNSFQQAIKDLQRQINQAEMNAKRLKQQLDTVKATQSVQRAQASIAQRDGQKNTSLQTAQDALERLQQRQAKKAALLVTTQDDDADKRKDALLEKLEQAGITSGSASANAVLNRLKRK